MRTSKRTPGFTLAETLLAIFLVGMAMGMLGLLFQRSFEILRTIDDKERARQAGRMGLDRLSSELREATAITSSGSTIVFEKIDPNAAVATPFPAPTAPPENYVPPDFTPSDAYPDSERLDVRYRTENESLIRDVRTKGSGAWSSQVVVVGVNSFQCTLDPANDGEVEVLLAVRDNRQINTYSSRILCPCIKEPFH